MVGKILQQYGCQTSDTWTQSSFIYTLNSLLLPSMHQSIITVLYSSLWTLGR